MQHRHNHYVRELLRRHSLGLTTGQIKQELKISQSTVTTVLKAMPDAYIVRWVRMNSQQCIPVWAVAMVPPNAPKP